MKPTFLLILISLTSVLRGDPLSDAMDNGRTNLFAGNFAAAISNFDDVAKKAPAVEPRLWQRGIAYYLAGRYADGVAQFERHQHVNPNDVENAAWHFICKARAENVTTARRALIPILGDRRVPMTEIHELFAGKIQPSDVLAAAEASPAAERDRALCYAHQYLGLYFEVLGRPDLAEMHMHKAASDHFYDSYMGHVAKAHDKKMKAERSINTMPKGEPYIVLRGGLPNARKTFTQQHRGRVAFIGGSITQANGWRQRVAADLAKRFPETEFSFVPAGIGSTGSTTGAFRLQADVLSKGKVDLLFIEFAVNDNQDSALSTTQAIRGMEGMIRQARAHNPEIDIVISYFVNPSHINDFQNGIVPDEIQAHESVAEHYNLPSIHLAREVADAVGKGAYTFKTYGGTHPIDFGQKVYANRVSKLFDDAWSTTPEAATMPENQLDERSYTRGRYIPLTAIALGTWVHSVPKWNSIPGNIRALNTQNVMIHSETPDEPLKATFTGTAVGAYILAGPDAGQLAYRIDGGPAQTIDLRHRFSANLHYPRTVLFHDELEHGDHVITVHLLPQHTSAPLAARILHLLAN
jgi:lysophospholipase L1-like esterase